MEEETLTTIKYIIASVTLHFEVIAKMIFYLHPKLTVGFKKPFAYTH